MESQLIQLIQLLSGSALNTFGAFARTQRVPFYGTDCV